MDGSSTLDYRYYCYTVAHQWALLVGYSGANTLSVHEWLAQPADVRRDFCSMIFAGGEL